MGLGLIALAIVLALNYIGVRIAVGAMLTFAAVSFVPMLILAIVIVAKGGADGISLECLDPGETGLLDLTGGGVLGGVLLGILLRRLRGRRLDRRGVARPAPLDPARRALHDRRRGRVLRRDVTRLSMGYGKKRVEPAPGRRPGGGQHDGDRVHRLLVRDHPRLVVILDAMALALAICVIRASSRSTRRLPPVRLHEDVAVRHAVGGNLVVAIGGIGLMLPRGSPTTGRAFLAPDDSGTSSRPSPTGSRRSSSRRRSARSRSSSST